MAERLHDESYRGVHRARLRSAGIHPEMVLKCCIQMYLPLKDLPKTTGGTAEKDPRQTV